VENGTRVDNKETSAVLLLFNTPLTALLFHFHSKAGHTRYRG